MILKRMWFWLMKISLDLASTNDRKLNQSNSGHDTLFKWLNGLLLGPEMLHKQLVCCKKWRFFLDMLQPELQNHDWHIPKEMTSRHSGTWDWNSGREWRWQSHSTKKETYARTTECTEWAIQSDLKENKSLIVALSWDSAQNKNAG